MRRLCLSELDLEGGRLRIEQSKGLNDRLVYLSEEVVEAIQAWLAVRGEAEPGLDALFVYRHRPLSRTYCAGRLKTYGRRCRVQLTPHQLRHSCATLLLNVGAPIVTVQTLLGVNLLPQVATSLRPK